MLTTHTHFLTTSSLPTFFNNLRPFCSKPGTHTSRMALLSTQYLVVKSIWDICGPYRLFQTLRLEGFARKSGTAWFKSVLASSSWPEVIAFLYHLGSGGCEAASHSTPTQIQIKSTSPSRVFPKSCSSPNRPIPKSCWRPILSVCLLRLSECDQKPAT